MLIVAIGGSESGSKRSPGPQFVEGRSHILERELHG